MLTRINENHVHTGTLSSHVKSCTHRRIVITCKRHLIQHSLGGGADPCSNWEDSTAPESKIWTYTSVAKCCCSLVKLCLTLCIPMNCSTPGFLFFTISLSLLKLMSIALVMLSNHLILCCAFSLFPSIFPSIKAFSNESALCTRWPMYWNFNAYYQIFNPLQFFPVLLLRDN